MTTRMKLLLLGAVCLFALSAAWNVASRVNTQTKTVASFESVIHVLQSSCEEEQALRRQYKRRAEDLIVLTKVVQSIVNVAITNPNSYPPVKLKLTQAGPDLKHIINTIHILPLPDCSSRAARLGANLPEG